MSVNFDITQRLDEAWTVDDMYASVITSTGQMIDLNIQNLLDYEVMWYGQSMTGIIEFVDFQDLSSNLTIASGGYIKIGFTSQAKSADPAEFERVFAINGTADKTNKEGREKSVRISFGDMLGKQLDTAFITKSFIDAKPSEGLGEFLKDSLGLANIIIAGDANELKTDFITPANMSAGEYLKKEFLYRGLNFIQDRAAAYLVHDSHMTNDKAVSTGEFFEYKPYITYSRAQVLEYDIEGLDMSKITGSTPALSNTINNENANLEEMATGTTQIEVQGAGTLGSISITDLHMQRGQKLSTSNQVISNETSSKDILDTQKMRIWVPGWNGNRLGMTVKVELPRPVGLDQSEDSEAYTGDWVVNKVRDKVISTYFIQELFLSRAGAI